MNRAFVFTPLKVISTHWHHICSVNMIQPRIASHLISYFHSGRGKNLAMLIRIMLNGCLVYQWLDIFNAYPNNGWSYVASSTTKCYKNGLYEAAQTQSFRHNNKQYKM